MELIIITLLMTSAALVVAGVTVLMTLDLYEIDKTQSVLFESTATQTEEQDSSTETQTQR